MSLWDVPAGELLDRTASAAPTPGGGSVSAVCAALGLGLVIMALEVTLRREAEDHPAHAELARARALLPLLRASADDDARAFDGYMAALALPRATDDEKRQRRAATREAALAATLVPLAAAGAIVDGLETALAAAPRVSPHVVSDVGAGADLLGGALRAVLVTVDINLPALPEDQRASPRTRRDDLLARAEALERAVRDAVAARLPR